MPVYPAFDLQFECHLTSRIQSGRNW